MTRNEAIRMAEKARDDTVSATKGGEDVPAPELDEKGRPGIMVVGGQIEGTEYNGELAFEKAVGQIGQAGIWQQMRLTDPQIQSLLLAMKLPVIGADWQVASANTRNSEVEDKDGADEHRDLAERGVFDNPEQDFRDTVRESLLFLDFGFMAFETVWELTKDGHHLPRKFGPRMPFTIKKWLEDDEGELDGVEHQYYDSKNGQFVTVDIPATKLILLSHNREGNNYAGMSALRPLWAMWRIKQMLLKLLSISFEREALGIPVATRPEMGWEPQQDDEVMKLLKNLRAHQKSYGVMPFGWNLDWYFNEGGGAARDSIIKAIRYIDGQILVSYMAQFLGLGTSPTGSRAVAREHTDLFWLILNGLAKMIASGFNGVGVKRAGVVRRIIDLNFGPQERYPYLVAQSVEGKNLMDFINSLEKVARRGFITPDDVTENYLRSMMGIPRKRADAIPNVPAEVNKAPPVPGKETSDNAMKRRQAEIAGTGKAPEPKVAPQNPVQAHDHDDPVLLVEPGDEPVAYAEIDARYMTVLDELTQAVNSAIAQWWNEAKEGILAAAGRGDVIPTHDTSLSTAIFHKIQSILSNMREYGGGQVSREAERERNNPYGLPLDKGPGVRKFADPEDLDEEDLAEFLEQVRKQRHYLTTAAAAVAEELATQAVSQMHMAILANMRRGIDESIGAEALFIGPTTVQAKALGLTAAAFTAGREEIAATLADEIAYVEHSAVLDRNTCGPCREAHGKRFRFGSREHMEHQVPYIKCEGGHLCRCMLVYRLKRF